MFLWGIVCRCICCGRMQRWGIKARFSRRSENRWARGIQSSFAFLSEQTCKENQGMFSEVTEQQWALLCCGIISNFIVAPSQVKKARNTYIFIWFFHFQAWKTANLMQSKTKYWKFQGIQFQKSLSTLYW